MGLEEFIKTYFIEPISHGTGYNMYNTLVYGVLLLLGAYGVVKLVRRLGVKMDKQLFNAVLPFVVLGGILRALEEFARLTGAGLLPHSPLFLTPGIYLLIAALSLPSLVVAVSLKGEEYPRAMSAIGWTLSLAASLLVLSDIALVASGGVADTSLRPSLFLWIVLLAVGLTFIGMLILKRLQMRSRENALILGGFAFEASAVTTAVYSLSYSAEQPFTQALLSISPPFYPLFKLALILGIVYYIEGVPREDETHWLSKLILLVLGVPMGIHNSLQILLGL
jgi:uncharacterized membrane protein